MSWKRSSEYDQAMAEARLAAQEALEGTDLMGLGVDPLAFCESQDIPVVSADEAGVELPRGVAGSTQYCSGGYRIVLRSTANFGFQNFTLAHELGHICIGSHQRLFTGGQVHYSGDGFNGSTDLHERQADHFASAFLMPEQPCRKFLDAIPDDEAGLAAIQQLKDACEVSLTAAAIRYCELTSHVAAIVVSSGGKVEYCFRSKELIDQIGWDARIAKGAALPRYTASERLASKPALVAAGGSEEGEATWTDWFGKGKTEIFEEAVGLGSYGKVLTVLTANG